MTSRTERWIAAFALIALCLLGIVETTGSPAIKDASETLRMALDLERHGVISIDEHPPYAPSMIREPIPIVTTASAVAIEDAILGAAAPDRYFSGERVRLLKLQNLVWLCVLAISVFAAIRRFTASFWAALLGAALAVSPFTWFMPAALKMYIGVDSLDTDLAGTALLSAATIMLAAGFPARSIRVCAAAGLCFGVLALTKAAMFYVYPSVLCLLVAYGAAYAFSRGAALRPWVAPLLALVIPFLAVSVPWMARNYVQTGFFAIAERGGPVLLYRAYLDEVTAEEYRGAFSAWGGPYARTAAARLTGFGPRDLEAGGRLQRLAMQFSGAAQEREIEAEESGEPERAVSWYRKSRAVYNGLLAKDTAAGDRYPSGEADQATRNQAIGLIMQRPIKHVLVMLPLIWRGALTTFPLLVITLVYAWRRRREDLMLYVLPALILIGFLAGATHFSERYGYVPAAEATTCLMILICLAARRYLRLLGHDAAFLAQNTIDK